MAAAPILLNDVHSRLNPTPVTRVCRPDSLAAVQSLVREAKRAGATLSLAGGRHAMGGQQFARDSWHVDTRALNRVLEGDPLRGLLRIEAGATWPEIITASHALGTGPDGRGWGIRQKQTGVDDVTLGGSISANAHGRGLRLAPLGADIEALTLVDAHGAIVHCDRTHNAELFALVIGGYGLFGIIYAATLRLAPRLRVRRRVDVIDLDDAVHTVFRRAAEGCLYGDFQFVIDAADAGFLRRGVLACYQPDDSEPDATERVADLAPETWLKLLKLAHEDKRTAFKLYAQHYLGTDGNHYWSDTHQLSTYLPTYAEFLDQMRGPEDLSAGPESLLIGEHYVPHERLLDFMQQACAVLRQTGTEVIYGTIRAIQRDVDSFLPWARQDYVCIVFNLRTPHHADGCARTAASFRGLIDAALALGGSFFLTYHRYATAHQVLAAYPRFREFLALKRRYDPETRFSSEWYRHYCEQFAALPE